MLARSITATVITMATLLCNGVMAEDASDGNGKSGQTDDAKGKKLFEDNCSVCHNLELPRAQRLDRKTWGWVVSDMVSEFGATWITEEQQKIIIDYLAKNYGPDRPRD
jgi:mono/diheme cytochrome c family protein